MADRVLSIEVGYSITKVCEIDRGSKAPKILNNFVIETPDGMLRDGVIEQQDSFVNSFRDKISEKNIKTKKAIFTIASSRMATRDAVIPYVKEKQIKDVVRANLSEYFPVDPSLYLFSHSIIGLVHERGTEAQPAQIETKAEPATEEESIEGAEEGKKKKPAKEKAPKTELSKPTGYKIQVLAAPKALITSYERLAKSLGLSVESIDYNGNSVYQAAREQCKNGVQLIIKIDERSSLLMVLEDGVISLNRTIPYGTDEAVGTLMQTKQLGDVSDYDSALELARRKTTILNSFSGETMATETDEENLGDLIRADKKLVTESLRSLVGGIVRVIDYYNSNHSRRPIERAFITGIGADFSGIGTLLSNELDMKVKNLTKLSGIDIEKSFKDATFGEYVSVIGASIDPLTFYPDHEEGKSKGSSKASSGSLSEYSLFIALGVLVLGIVGSIVMILVTLAPYKEQKALNEKYKKTITDLQPSYDTYVEYVNSVNDVAYLRQIEHSTENRNYQMMEFVKALETDMPFTFRLNTMESDTEKLTIDCTVLSKEEAAFVIDKLKKMEMFTSTEVTSITYVEDELGGFSYNFTAEMYYAPLEEPDLETEEGA